MRWKRRVNKISDTRVKHKFLFLPLCIKNEWRWLEKTKWEQQCVHYDGFDYFWKNTKWVE